MTVVLDLAGHRHENITGPSFSCAFSTTTFDCTSRMRWMGGFDQHHPWPLELGGPQKQQFLILCPTHHRRQHALIRVLVEHDGVFPVGLLRPNRVGTKEKTSALLAYSNWVSADRPDIKSWPCLAASVPAA